MSLLLSRGLVPRRGLLAPLLARHRSATAATEDRGTRTGGSSRALPREPWEEIYTAQAIDPSEKTFGKILVGVSSSQHSPFM